MKTCKETLIEACDEIIRLNEVIRLQSEESARYLLVARKRGRRIAQLEGMIASNSKAELKREIRAYETMESLIANA